MLSRPVDGLAWLAVATIAVVTAVLPPAEATSAAAATRAPVSATTSLTPAQRATVSGLREVNYYPAAEGWGYMWTRFDANQIGSDFARLQALGANTVRVIVPPYAFGYPTVRPDMARHLRTVLNLAASHGLQVQLTLFDWFRAFSDVSGSREWVSSLLSPYRTSDEISIVEVHNELDPSSKAAMVWARKLIPYVKRVMPSAIVTVSSASIPPTEFSTFVSELASALPTVWDYHYYGSARYMYSTLAQIKKIAGSTPLIIGETGMSTINKPAPQALTGDSVALDQAQAAFYRVAFSATKALHLPDPAPWTLYDFAPNAIPPSRTADDARQYDFGLYRANGTAKPAAQVVSAAFHGRYQSSIDGNFAHESWSTGANVTGAWSINGSGSADFAINPDTGKTGGPSASIGSSAGSMTDPPAFYATPVQPVTAGSRWTASALVRGSALTGGTRVALAWYDRSHRLLQQSPSVLLPTGDTPWMSLTATAAAPPNAQSVLVLLESWGNRGTAWFRSVQAGPAS